MTHALQLIQGGTRAQAQTTGEPQEPIAERVLAAAMTGLSAHSCRVYTAHVRRYLATGAQLNRENIQHYLRHMETRGTTAQVRNQALAALKKLALEAAELGWITHAQSLQIHKLKAKRTLGIRTGRWLTLAQATALLASVDRTSLRGKRDAAVLALLLGCGLRRAEACALETEQLQRHNGRLLIVNLVGKGGRVRTIQVPAWAALLVSEWTTEVPGGKLLRSIRADGTIGASLSPSAIRLIVAEYGNSIKVDKLLPHDMRRTYAKLSRLGGAQLETIQKSLGHSSLKTTESYLSTGEEANAGDFFTP